MYLLLLSFSFVLPTEIKCQSFPLWELLREFPSLSNGIASQMDCIFYRAKVYSPLPLGMSSNFGPSPVIIAVSGLTMGVGRAGEQISSGNILYGCNGDGICPMF